MPDDSKLQDEIDYLTADQRTVLRRVDERLRGRRGSVPTTVRVDAGDWTTVEGYVERIIAARLAPITALHPKIEEPRHGCCAPPKLCTGHVPECGSRSHGVNRPAWPCADLRALSNPPADPKEASDG